MKLALLIVLLVLGACAHHGKKGHDCSCDKKKEVVAAPVEFEGNCPMGLCRKKGKVKCDPNITAAYKGKNYCFSTIEARDTFMKDIDKNVKEAQERWADIITGRPRG